MAFDEEKEREKEKEAATFAIFVESAAICTSHETLYLKNKIRKQTKKQL